MAECNEVVSEFYEETPGLSFSHTQGGFLSSKKSNTYVNDNIKNNTDIDDVSERKSILKHEKCYLHGNLQENNNTYTSGNFYKSSSMIEDLKSYVDTDDPRNGNVCGQGKYIHSQIDPTTGEMVEECYDCGTPPPGKEILDYDITTRIVTVPSALYSGELKVTEEGRDPTLLGTIEKKKKKDFEQDYTMYRYGIGDKGMLANAVDDDGFLRQESPIRDEAISIHEEHGTEGTPPDKLDEATFLDVQKQCSPLISDWFPSQHSRNMNRERSEIFDTNTIQYEGVDSGTDKRRATDLLQGNPIDIMDFFDLFYNNLPELDGLEKHKISRVMLNSGNKSFSVPANSIINNIRILDVNSPPISDIKHHTDKLKPCGNPNNSKCELINGKAYYKTIPEELARAWIAKKLDSIKKDELQTQQGNLGTLYGDLSNMFRNVDSSIENCINNIVGGDEKGHEIITRIEKSGGDLSTLTQKDVHYLRRKIVRFIHSPDEKIRKCIDMMYLKDSSNLCTEGLYHKTSKILTVLFSLLSINLDLSDIETNNEKYNNVMNFIDSLGDLFPRAIEKIVRIIQGLEKDLCNTSNKSDIIVNLYDDLMNKNRVYNVELGMFGKLFSMDDNQFSRIVGTYNMFSPILGRLFAPADNTLTT
tara:strand:+ start:1954 stop:3882 length:1929 start_codon:yes stop_codon:yes gene_type:complete